LRQAGVRLVWRKTVRLDLLQSLVGCRIVDSQIRVKSVIVEGGVKSMARALVSNIF
jgi:hypothetical protein